MSLLNRDANAMTGGHSIVDGFANLADNWDGYGASSISGRTRDNAHRFVTLIEAAPLPIPASEITPMPTGTISFEWDTPRAEAYLEIGNTRYSGFIKEGRQRPNFLRGRADSLDQTIPALIHRTLSLSAHSALVTEVRRK